MVVGVSNGSVNNVGASGTVGIRRVLITPLGLGPHPSEVSTQAVPHDIIDKVVLKTISKTGKKGYKLFIHCILYVVSTR